MVDSSVSKIRCGVGCNIKNIDQDEGAASAEFSQT
jgi:hypothetical protein